MMRIICGDVADTDCDFRVGGDSKETVKDAMLEHLQKDHKDYFESLREEDIDEMEKQIDGLAEDLLTPSP